MNVVAGLVGTIASFNLFCPTHTADGFWFTPHLEWHLEGREVLVRRPVASHEEITEGQLWQSTGTAALTPVPGANRLLSVKKMIAPTSQKSGIVPSFRVGDERLIKLTENAGKKVGALLSKQGRPNGVLRVAVVGGGCSGLQYKMDLQDRPANRDFLVESAGARVVVDPKSALYVTGSELDYVDALNDGGFKVKNPNAATSCSCGESFSA